MRAITCTEYGSPDVLQLTETPAPTPSDNEVLLRVVAASVNPLDWHLMRGTPYVARLAFGLFTPKQTRPGRDVAGQVEAVGRNVTQFRPGDEVFGVCNGAFAEYACAAGSSLAMKPGNVSFEQAAAVPVAAITALQGLRDKGRIQAGQKVLVNGAAGGVGTFAVQIAKSFGAHVTGVCSTRNAEMVRSIGASRVIDYTQEDFTRSGERYDVVFDAVGNRPLSDRRRALSAGGILVMAGAADKGRWLGPLAGVLAAGVVSKFVRQPLLPFLAHVRQDDLLVLREWLEAGRLVPVIDRTYALDDVAAAVRYLEEGHARGKVVIAVARG
jgi:NADPH:quinone reductase-like Zn-dependent oxidoreductase